LQTLYDVEPFDLVLLDVVVPEEARTQSDPVRNRA
jgi:hypothetical protein